MKKKIDTSSEESINKAAKELGQESIKTMPQIMIDGQYIRGYDNLEKYLSIK